MSTSELHWYQHVQGGAVHGFTLPLPTEIAAQVQAGRLRPCPPPDHTPALELSEQQLAQLQAQDRSESVAQRRARLLAELAELGDDDAGTENVPPLGSPRADELPGGDTLSAPPPKARRRAS